jgi:HEAT repeat protein
MQGLAQRGDDVSVEALLQLSREKEDIGMAALSALGGVRSEGGRMKVAEELKKRMADGGPAVVSAAAAGYIRVKGDESLADVRAFLLRNYERPDGMGQQVCGAAVKALGDLDTEAGDLVLIEELARGVQPTWLPDYGSEVVRALAKAGRRSVERRVGGRVLIQPPRALSAAAREALLAYGETLKRKMPGPDNPPGRKFYEEKIAEVRAVLVAPVAPVGPAGGPPPPLP